MGKKALKGMGLLLTSPNGTRKIALLINLAGETVGEIFDGLPDNSIDASLSRQWYQLLKVYPSKYTGYFTPLLRLSFVRLVNYSTKHLPVQSFILASNYMQLWF